MAAYTSALVHQSAIETTHTHTHTDISRPELRAPFWYVHGDSAYTALHNYARFFLCVRFAQLERTHARRMCRDENVCAPIPFAGTAKQSRAHTHRDNRALALAHTMRLYCAKKHHNVCTQVHNALVTHRASIILL